jgi:isopenicillin-N epimerase
MNEINYRDLFAVEKGYIALNHGSFGACPREILNYQNQLRAKMESLTTRFFLTELKPLLKDSLSSLAKYVNSPVEDIAFVRNATTAANSVLFSLNWERGDEIVTTNLIYESCRNLINHIAETKGINLKTVEINFLPKSEDEIISAIVGQLSPKTKLVFIDHITSETSLIMPVEKICEELHKREIPVFVDGAHAPGMVELDLKKLSVDYYTGNCHKWICAPKASAFLYAKPERKEELKPAVIGNYFFKGNTESERFFNRFYWSGTDDYTPQCSAGRTIRYFENLVPGGWESIKKQNRAKVIAGRNIISEKLGFTVYTPEKMTGSMVTIPLGSQFVPEERSGLDIWQLELLMKYRIEAVIIPLYPTRERALRLSAHLYNTLDDYAYLAECLSRII